MKLFLLLYPENGVWKCYPVITTIDELVDTMIALGDELIVIRLELDEAEGKVVILD